MKLVAYLAVLLWFSQTPVLAKGGLQLNKGALTNVTVDGDTLSLAFTGQVSFSVPTAPPGHPNREWQPIYWTVDALPLRIVRWKPSLKPDGTVDDAKTFEAIGKLARQIADTGHEAIAAVSDPKISFSNAGEPTLLEGSQLYLYDMTELRAQTPSADSATPAADPAR